ncbi:hypothetical protein G3I44_13590 [Halogeometricum borinquense]|uniref:Uncharacterized protein n=1 Tax=Halogeometricum borinquense TaxID=60847 RepID=A0A6C0UI81_9EURY|nr:hypothetical protein [Halogeometricum borinquense]QIB75226.1 hypothetical protein G3I44_13590 [Halogeometricum borinquense]
MKARRIVIFAVLISVVFSGLASPVMAQEQPQDGQQDDQTEEEQAQNESQSETEPDSTQSLNVYVGGVYFEQAEWYNDQGELHITVSGVDEETEVKSMTRQEFENNNPATFQTMTLRPEDDEEGEQTIIISEEQSISEVQITVGNQLYQMQNPSSVNFLENVLTRSATWDDVWWAVGASIPTLAIMTVWRYRRRKKDEKNRRERVFGGEDSQKTLSDDQLEQVKRGESR